MKEAAELRNPTDMYYAQPLKDNLFEWHFTVRGPADTDFDGGIYHGRILLPVDYPMKPPSVILLTPNGRFQLNQKICLSISGHHPESWQPSWSIRTALLALIGFMPTHSAGALGSLEYPPAERKKLAVLSRDWVCSECGLCMRDALANEATPEDAKVADEARRLASQISFKNEFDTKKSVDVESNDKHIRGDSNGNESTPPDVGVEQQARPEDPPNLNSSIVPESEGPRQRATAAAINEGPAETAATHRPVVSSASVQRSVTSHGFSWELFAIFLLSIAFAALLYRRLSGVL
ncbi:unnamed protein product [Toxocara canis]|nr:unnamed protein product [Toxocara canis]